MKKRFFIIEMKISMPLYKILYAVLFIVLLSLIRGVAVSYEIGIAMDPVLAILAATFCADTYALEVVSRRSEVWRLYPLKKKIRAVGRRLLIQQLFLLLLSTAGYGLFYLFQKPIAFRSIQSGAASESAQFFCFLAAAAVTIAFWGMLSNMLACLFHNMWFGVGGSLILWLLLNSGQAQRLFGSWNVFSYAFRDVGAANDLAWLHGKALCVLICIAAAAALPALLKKR